MRQEAEAHGAEDVSPVDWQLEREAVRRRAPVRISERVHSRVRGWRSERKRNAGGLRIKEEDRKKKAGSLLFRLGSKEHACRRSPEVTQPFGNQPLIDPCSYTRTDSDVLRFTDRGHGRARSPGTRAQNSSAAVDAGEAPGTDETTAGGCCGCARGGSAPTVPAKRCSRASGMCFDGGPLV
jgi:hypothetical protein